MNNIMEGKVVSARQMNTIIVAVVHQYRHPLYKKAVNRTKKYAVDTAGKTYSVGDAVRICETRPISRRKHFKVL